MRQGFNEVRKRILASGIAVLLLASLTACGSQQAISDTGSAASTGSAGQAGGKQNWPKELNYGLIPAEVAGNLGDVERKFAEDMGNALGIKVNVYVGDDYTSVIEAMRAKKVDLGYFGPFSYIIAHQEAGAEPIACKATSKENAFYHSEIVVPADSPAKTIADLKGKTFLYADPASTSGHLFPQAMISEELNIPPEKVDSFFSNVSYSGGHDKSIIAIAHHQADGAGVCDVCIQRFIDAGMVKASDFRVIKTSAPIPLDPLTYRNDLPPDLVAKIKEFVLNYDKQNPDYFKKTGTKAFYPMTDADYKIVYDTAKILHMTPQDILKKK
ncbi:MAG TPA: phosphate/phosphite/phosphonate ABC transporter substrate-binding protein [Alicyclobacillus sp.]|nr:phosphate/phosphite/phosphonate ABC transporter substrate-binding protein [Alicyclobacillus sp.]